MSDTPAPASRWRGLTRATACGLVASLAAIAPALPAAHAETFAAAGTVELAFTPGDAADAMIVQALARAEREVLVLAYTFTHPGIARALTGAHRRGVRVEVLADRAQTLELPQSAVPALAREGVPVWLDGNFGAAHNKVLIIDADGAHPTTITGSFNFTLAAQKRNAENVALLRDNPDVARAFRAYFRRLQTKAQRWSGEGALAPAAKRRGRAESPKAP
jgi:phosphatidylserine/phosphatidylglycerophosphate/cardiolipin synthase-like enzyme